MEYASVLYHVLKNRLHRTIHWAIAESIIKAFGNSKFSKLEMTKLIQNEYDSLKDYHTERFNFMRSYYDCEAMHTMYKLLLCPHNYKLSFIHSLLTDCQTAIVNSGKPEDMKARDNKYITGLIVYVQNKLKG